MFFELTPDLASSILFSMEDQTKVQLFDAQQGVLVEEDSEHGILCDEERFYSLPEWSSGDGYSLLEDFTNSLHSPLVREELRQVLISGRGVFRNFKNVLKAYPIYERKWHFFKHEKMYGCVLEWYNALRESWGLEALEADEGESFDETCELVKNDFQFREYDPDGDGDDVSAGSALIMEEYKRLFAGEAGDAVAFMWDRHSMLCSREEKFGFVCRSADDDFTGCILVSFCPSYAKKTVTVTDFFVSENYRGLGIGRELFSMCLAFLRNHGIQWVLISNTVIPESMESMLTQWGFEKLGSGYLADLFNESV